ncbi:MAG: HAMP domain-containing histidine kinase [Opitutaceae bacterium]|nr:HAMP domain-containing histidine kinase [Opitutaceae bacterium]
MNAPREPQATRVAGFRTKLRVATMVVVTLVTVLGLYVGERSLAGNAEADMRREFQGELAVLRNARAIRHAGLVERCRSLVRRSRIQSALEDDALDLLYPSAENELRDLMAPAADSAPGTAAPGLQAKFYRFLGRDGAVIPANNPRAVGALSPAEEKQLALPALPAEPQTGYLTRETAAGEAMIFEVIAMPILSMETGEPIAALVLGFEPPAVGRREARSGMKIGVQVRGRLHSAALSPAAEAALAREVRDDQAAPVRVLLEGEPHLLFAQRLNADSLYAPALEVCVFPLAELEARQARLRWQVLGAGALLLLVGLGGSHVVSARFAAPVEKLASDSEENRTQRARAEAALEMTSAELQRSARFSADASHQLKTPVTVLRAGLEELLANDNLTPEECDAISALIHQTYRLSSLIEDLLLLSRMDAGRLKLAFGPVNLSALIEASLDDLGAAPDGLAVRVETDFPPDLHIAGEKRYTAIILHNLLENARKYNVPDGRIRIAAVVEGEVVTLTVANTGRTIAPAAQSHIFERFHRGVMGENVPGYGLGLNLARELARLHLGDLRLLRSDENWTVFEVRLRWSPPPLRTVSSS